MGITGKAIEEVQKLKTDVSVLRNPSKAADDPTLKQNLFCQKLKKRKQKSLFRT
jgi:hypothetical protein